MKMVGKGVIAVSEDRRICGLAAERQTEVEGILLETAVGRLVGLPCASVNGKRNVESNDSIYGCIRKFLCLTLLQV